MKKISKNLVALDDESEGYSKNPSIRPVGPKPARLPVVQTHDDDAPTEFCPHNSIYILLNRRYIMRLRRSNKWPGVRRKGNLLAWTTTTTEEDSLAFYGSDPGDSIEDKPEEETDVISGWEDLLPEESCRIKPKLGAFLAAALAVASLPTEKPQSSSDTASQGANSVESTLSIKLQPGASSLETTVMELQAKYNDYSVTRRKLDHDARMLTSTNAAATVAFSDGCYLYDSLICIGQASPRQALLLQSPAAAAMVCFSPNSNRYGPYRFLTNTTSSQPHVNFLESLVQSCEPIELDLLAQAWKEIPGSIEKKPKDWLSKAMRGCSLASKNGNLDMAQWLQAVGGSLGGTKVNAAPNAKLPENCPICLEHFDRTSSTIVQLDGCGHRFCLECAVSYTKSCPRGQLPCPAGDGCATMMGIADTVHFSATGKPSNHGPEMDEDAILQNILYREMEQHCLANCNGKVCANPTCQRLLASTSPDKSDRGWNILHCACAAQTLCGNCHQRSHPGVSCSVYGNWRRSIDSGKADAETHSLRYITERSFPCPRCQFAIEKDGGCNHVRCTKCDYYFCYEWYVGLSTHRLLKAIAHILSAAGQATIAWLPIVRRLESTGTKTMPKEGQPLPPWRNTKRFTSNIVYWKFAWKQQIVAFADRKAKTEHLYYWSDKSHWCNCGSMAI